MIFQFFRKKNFYFAPMNTQIAALKTPQKTTRKKTENIQFEISLR